MISNLAQSALTLVRAVSDIPAQQPIKAPPADFYAIAPEIILCATGLLILFMIAVKRFKSTIVYASVAIAGALASLGAGVFLWFDLSGDRYRYSFGGMIAADRFSAFLIVLTAVALVMALLLSVGYLQRESLNKAEYYILMLFCAAGIQLMVSANNLIMVFLGLELLSICLYVLVAFDRDRPTAQEAGMKYLLLGAYSSAIFAFGIALTYGGTGTMNIPAIAQYFSSNLLANQGVVLLGLAFMVIGLAFKMAAVPFHMWTPDVYEGAPSPVVGFMASGAKVAAFAALFRVVLIAFEAYRLDWQPLLWGIAVLTMLVGSIMALVQTNMKRMLAYSSIANAGFILIGVIAANPKGVQGALFYLVAYTFMVLGSFAVVGLAAKRGERGSELKDYRNFYQDEPILALILTFFLFAMAGIPGTSGFMAKFLVFSGAAASNQWVLIVIGTVASVVALYIYVRLVVNMYMLDSVDLIDKPGGNVRVNFGSGLALGIAVALTLFFGIYPEPLMNIANHAGIIF